MSNVYCAGVVWGFPVPPGAWARLRGLREEVFPQEMGYPYSYFTGLPSWVNDFRGGAKEMGLFGDYEVMEECILGFPVATVEDFTRGNPSAHVPIMGSQTGVPLKPIRGGGEWVRKAASLLGADEATIGLYLVGWVL